MEPASQQLATFKVGGHTIQFKKPSREDWDEAQKKTRSEKHSTSASFRELCLKTIVTPLEAFHEALKKKPAFPAVACRTLAVLAGRRLDAVVGADGESCTLTAPDGRAWEFSSPSFDVWEDFQEQLAQRKHEQEVLFRELAVRCLKDQTASPTLLQFFEDYPAGHEGLGSVLSELAGADIEVEVKKE